MSEVKVTILMPVCNAEPYIGEAIRSVLEQDVDCFELLIVNDGSTDNSAAVIERFNDPRIKVIHQENRGISAALNTGLAAARGEYIARFDADDICMPGRISKQVTFLDQNPGCLVCGSDAAYITAEGNHLFDFICAGHEHAAIMEKIYTHCPVIHSAAMFRKQVIQDAGGYPIYAHSFEDHLLWIQLKDKGLFHNIPEPLIKVRFSASSFTMDEKWRGKKFRKLKQAILRKGAATSEDGDTLMRIIKAQQNVAMRQGAYFALCGKKLLINNHRPGAARNFFRKAIQAAPLRPDSYVFYLMSFFPQVLIKKLHQATARKN